MAKSDTFQCSVVTPEATILECPASFVAFPAHDGEMGVLFNRAPLVCKLGIGQLRVESPDGDRVLYVDGGFAEVSDNRLTLLTEQARDPSDLDCAAADQALIEARAMKISDEASLDARTNSIKRAQVQIKLAKSLG